MDADGLAIVHWDTLQLVGDPENSAPLVAPNIPRANSNGDVRGEDVARVRRALRPTHSYAIPLEPDGSDRPALCLFLCMKVRPDELDLQIRLALALVAELPSLITSDAGVQVSSVTISHGRFRILTTTQRIAVVIARCLLHRGSGIFAFHQSRAKSEDHAALYPIACGDGADQRGPAGWLECISDWRFKPCFACCIGPTIGQGGFR